jgi:ParB family transcriptional regulator, chromosome partitioning protein
MDMSQKLKMIPIEKLELWDEANVRKNDALSNITDLATSIKKNGVRIPLLVKPTSGIYKVFSGQRRLEAAQIAKIESIPCYIFEDISLRDAMMLSLTENVLREAMTKEDKSVAASRLLKLCKGIDKVSKIMGVSEGTVRGYLRYDDIPQELRDYKKQGLTSKNIEDIFVKFPTLDDAIAVAKDLVKITDKKKKSAYGVAIRKSIPSDKPSDIRKRATKIEHSKPIKILLDDDYYRTLSKVAFVRKRTDEEFTTEIVEDWIDGYAKGEHRD